MGRGKRVDIFCTTYMSAGNSLDGSVLGRAVKEDGVPCRNTGVA